LEAFFEQQKRDTVEMLLSAVRHAIRDNQKESRLAGKVEAYENTLRELEQFAREQLQVATQ
jgi:hypothetical protein